MRGTLKGDGHSLLWFVLWSVLATFVVADKVITNATTDDGSVEEAFAYFPSHLWVQGYVKFTTVNETLANATGLQANTTPMAIDIYIEQGLSATETYTIEIYKGIIPDARCRKAGAIFNPTNVNMRDEEYYCNRFNARSKCALGDLSGRFGVFYAQNHGFNTTWYDYQLSLNGYHSIADRSVFIRNSTGGPVTCANIKFADPTMQRRRASATPTLGTSQALMSGWTLLAVVALVSWCIV